MSFSTNDTIFQFQEQIARMSEQIAQLQNANNVDKDPQIQEQIPTTIFHPSDAEASRYPAIRPSDALFLFKKDISDDEFWDQFQAIPKNAAVGYEPPKIPTIIHSSSAERAHDAQLRALQKRLANLTRPVDLFLHQVWSLEDRDSLDTKEMVELCSNFGIFMRDHLAAVAGRINTMRTDNLRATQGTTYKDDPLHLVDPKQFQEEVKSLKALANAFKPRQTNGHQQKQTESKRNSPQSSCWDKAPRDAQFKRRDDNSNRGSSSHQNRSRRRGNSQQRGQDPMEPQPVHLLNWLASGIAINHWPSGAVEAYKSMIIHMYEDKSSFDDLDFQ
ncbi:hypothetical protein BGZ50_009687 [Haplosporangium sp. Z 11]|nr:hypothetical protein BGZ50_009687 [Haplosporangium sp. Z 11]